MEQWAQAELQATCSNLGSYDGLKYQIDPDSVECVKDLIRFLRRDGENHEIRRCMGEIQVVQSDLIHILKDHANKRELFDVTLRLLVNLTNPELLLFKEELPEDKETRNFYMQIQNQRHHYKQAFVDKDLWAVLSKTLGALLKKDWDERFEDDKLIIERILILVRNILQVPTNIRAEKRIEGDASLHDQILWVLHQSGMQDLLLYIASSESEINYCLHVLEIISLLFREQDPTSLARANLSRSAEEKAADEDALTIARKMEAEKAKVKMKTTPSSRHSRFGGTFVLQNVKSISDRNLIISKPLQGIQSVDFDDKKRGRCKAKNKRTPDEMNVARRSTLSVRMFLKEFCTEFLMSAYNQLMNVVKDALNRQKAQQNDETYYLWAMKFFMEFNRGDNFRVEMVTETMSRQTFHYIQQQIDNYRDNFEHEKKNRPKYLMWGRRMHLAIKAYQELLLTLVHMEGSKDPTVKDAGKILMAGVFYEPEYRELCLQQLSSFNQDKMSLGYLTDLVHTTHVFLKLMEHMSKGKHLMVSKKTKVKKPKKKGDKSTSGGAGEGSKRMEKEEMWEMVSGELSATLQGRREIPTDVVPFDAVSDVPVEDQKEDAMKNLQKALIAKDAGKAVALLRAARSVWPDGDAFGAADSEAEEEFMALREILFADLGIEVEQEQDNAGQVGEEEEEDEVEEEEDQGAKFYSIEQEFNYKAFVARFAVKNVITPFGILFSNYAKNSKSTNHVIIKMFHRAAVECELPALLYQASIFRVFQLVWRDLSTNSKDQSLRELAKFAKFILEKFMTLAANNKKMFIELLLWKTSREATEIQEGYGTQAATKNQKKNMWIAEDEEKLTTIFQQVREMEAQNPSADMLDTVVSMFEHEGRSRRQIGGKLKELGLIGSVKEISKRPVGVSREWTEEEVEKVVELYNEFKDAENPAARMYEQWKASGLVKRSKGKLIDKIMQLELCDDRSKLGKIKKKNRKPKEGEDGYLTRKSDSDSAMEDSSEGEGESGSESSSDNEDEGDGGGGVSIVDALKKVVDEKKSALEWLAGLLEDEAGDREDEDGEDVPILPLAEETIKAVDDEDFQVVLEQCGLTKPLAGEQYWRIPGPISAPVLKTRASVIKMAMEGNWEMEGIDQAHLKIGLSGKGKKKKEKEKTKKKRGPNKWLPFRRDDNFVPISTTSGAAEKSSDTKATNDSDSEKNDENVDPENKENAPVRKKTANQKKSAGIDRSRIMRLLNDDSSDDDEANKKDDSTSDEGVDDPSPMDVANKKKMLKKPKEKVPRKPRAKKVTKKAKSNEKKKVNSSSDEDDDSSKKKEKQKNAFDSDSSEEGKKDSPIKKGKQKNAFDSDSSDEGVLDPTQPSETPITNDDKTNSSVKKGKKKNTFDSDSSSDDGVVDPTQPSKSPIRNDDNDNIEKRNKKNSLDSDSDEDVPMVRKSNQKLALDSDSEDELETKKPTKVDSDSEDEPVNQKKTAKIDSDTEDEDLTKPSEAKPATKTRTSRSPSVDSRSSRSRSRSFEDSRISLDDSRVSRSRSSSPPRYVDATVNNSRSNSPLNDSRSNSPLLYVDATLNDSRRSRSRSRSVSPTQWVGATPAKGKTADATPAKGETTDATPAKGETADATPAEGETPITSTQTESVSTPVTGKRSRRSVATPASQTRKNKKARID